MWIARDVCGNLILFKNYPVSWCGLWYDSKDSPYRLVLEEDVFPDLTFDASPQEVEIELKDK